MTKLSRPRDEVGGTPQRCYNGGMATRARTRVTALLVVAAVLVGIAGVSAVRADRPPSCPPIAAARSCSPRRSRRSPRRSRSRATSRHGSRPGCPMSPARWGARGPDSAGSRRLCSGPSVQGVALGRRGTGRPRERPLGAGYRREPRRGLVLGFRRDDGRCGSDLAALSQRAAGEPACAGDDDAPRAPPRETLSWIRPRGARGAGAVRPRCRWKVRRGRGPGRLRPGPDPVAGPDPDRARRRCRSTPRPRCRCSSR